MGGAKQYIKIYIQKVNLAFIHLCQIWKAKVISIATNLRIFRSNEKFVLLYGWQNKRQERPSQGTSEHLWIGALGKFLRSSDITLFQVKNTRIGANLTTEEDVDQIYID